MVSPSRNVPCSILPITHVPRLAYLSKIGILNGPSGFLPFVISNESTTSKNDLFSGIQAAHLYSKRDLMLSPCNPLQHTHDTSRFTLYPIDLKNGAKFLRMCLNLP